MKQFISLMFFLAGITFITAQQKHSVSGIVRDYHDNTVLENATVQIQDQRAKTDENGRFVLNNIASGRYRLTVSHPECAPFTEMISVQQNLDLSLRLEHHMADIETVTLHKTHRKSDKLTVKSVSREEIDRNATENLGNALAAISGVGTLKTGNNIAKPVIHGLYGSRISILNNGVKLAEQEWGAEHAPNVDITQFDHIDVLKGASTLKFGADSPGGVIMLIPEVFRKEDALNGAVNLSAISNGRGLGFDLKLTKTWESGWAVSVNGGTKKLGDLQTPDYHLQNTGLNFNSFALRMQNSDFLQGISAEYSVTNQEIGIFRGSHVGNLEDYYDAINLNAPLHTHQFSYDIANPKQDVQHHIAKISAYRRLNGFGKFSADYSLQYNHRREYDVRRGELSEIPSLDLELFTNRLSVSNLLERKAWNLETGIDLTYQYNYSTPETMARRLVPNYTKYEGSVFSVFKYDISPKFSAEAGLRYDISKFEVKKWFDLADWLLYAHDFAQFYVRTEGNRVFTVPQLRFKNLSANVGFHYKASDHLNLKINFAQIGRTPNIAELFADGLHHSAAVIEVGNMRLKNETATQLNLHLDSKINVLEGLQLSLNPYWFKTRNFINQIPTGIQNTIRGVFPVWTYEQIDAEMFGIDFDAVLELTSNYRYKGQFSYVQGDDRTNGQPLILMLPPNFSNSLQFTEASWKDFYVQIENQTFLRQTRFPVFNPTIMVYENGNDIEKIVDLSTPPAGYSLWKLQTGLRFNKSFSANISVSNVFNKNYRDYLNRMRFFADEMGRNVIFGLKYNF